MQTKSDLRYNLTWAQLKDLIKVFGFRVCSFLFAPLARANPECLSWYLSILGRWNAKRNETNGYLNNTSQNEINY